MNDTFHNSRYVEMRPQQTVPETAMYGEHLERGYALMERGSDAKDGKARGRWRGAWGPVFNVWSGLSQGRGR